jgi:hypothetical protein
MRASLIFVSLLFGICACGHYGPPVRSASQATASAEAPADPNSPCEPEPER